MYCFDYRKRNNNIEHKRKPRSTNNHLPSDDYLRRELKKFYFDFDKKKNFMSSKKRELVSF